MTDPDPSWNQIETNPPEIAGDYETLDSNTGKTGVLFKSIKSGGWWTKDNHMWEKPITHWRTISL